MQIDPDLLAETDLKKLQACLTFFRIAIQRHKIEKKDEGLFFCLPENGGAFPTGVVEYVGSATHCRIQIAKLRQGIREYLTDKNKEKLYRLISEDKASFLDKHKTLST